jgi:hypothetical protein
MTTSKPSRAYRILFRLSKRIFSCIVTLIFEISPAAHALLAAEQNVPSELTGSRALSADATD